ncbi:MAG: hypothetical protein Q9213_005745 [Squamulea squamosa]
MPIRLGIIGLSANPQAWATMAHLAPIKDGGPLSSHYKLTALSTSSPETAKAAAKAYGLPEEKAYSNPEDIAKDPDVDMVVVSVKVAMHKQLTMPALKAGKDVFVEWPLGNGLQESEEMAQMAKKMGVRTFVGLQARMQPAFVKAKEIVQSGVLGRITSTTILGIDNQLLDFPEKARYINDPTSGASILSIPVTHTLDVILHVLSSELTSIIAQTSTTYPTVRFTSPDGTLSEPEPKRHADNITVSGLLTPGNTVLNFHYLITAPATPNMFQWIICGEKGAFKMEGKSFAVQMMPPKLYVAEAPSGGEGAKKDFYQSRDRGAEWKEVEVPENRLGCFGGVAEVYEGIAEGKGVEDVSSQFSYLAYIYTMLYCCVLFNQRLLSRALLTSCASIQGIVDFDEAVKRYKMVEAIAKSARDGTRESYL